MLVPKVLADPQLHAACKSGRFMLLKAEASFASQIAALISYAQQNALGAKTCVERSLPLIAT
jgi:hypothetical protein